MSQRLDPPLSRRRGATLHVLAVCRISGPNQDPKSLADREAKLQSFVADHDHGPAQWKVLATQGSGEFLDRSELAQLEELLESRRFDLLIVEDLGRIARRTRAYEICELAEDVETRVIALNDSVDTGRGDWQMNAFFSVLRHEMYNKDTSARIRRTLRNRFSGQGLIQAVVYGYIKPPGAKTDDRVSKDPDAEPIYDGWFRKLEDGASYAEVADWLNSLGVPTGPSCRAERWDGVLVRQTTFNSILKGLRVRNRKMSKRVNKTGRRRSVDAPPEERLERAVPHLAFIDPERYDRIIAMLKARNAPAAAARVDGRDARKDVPRKRSAWPGNHATCGICNRPYYYGGHGRKDFLMCSGCRLYRCWNGVSIDGPATAERLRIAIFEEMASLPEFDGAFLGLLREKAEAARIVEAGQLAELDRRQHKLDRQVANVVNLLAEGQTSQALREKLRELESERDSLILRRAELARQPSRAAELPSMERIKTVTNEAFAGLARDSPEFSRLMRRLVPRLEILPYRLFDGGAIVARARLIVAFTALVPEARPLGEADGVLRREIVVDLFEPPQRVAFFDRIKELRGRGLTQDQVATELGITQAAVQRSEAMGRQMALLGLEDPYLPLTEPPEDAPRLRRHKHSRYRFERLDREQGATSVSGPPDDKDVA